MGWIGATWIVVVVVLVCSLAPLVWLFWRRRWLSRLGSTFECAVRLNPGAAGGGWVLGLARIEGEYLEWFRVFSLSLTPRLRFRRTSTAALGSRDPTQAEAVVLYQGERVVDLRATSDFDDERIWELAMPRDNLTALLSWLEAAPPSLDRFRS
ncbi:DUF2550 domain-containing protein [Granulicoccus phenolivorans]|uniref:DUF2550 domain-containing protein n=1 Tax=Granulicoccus phenolivorans TaxID=266854 RepID=UPI000688CF93|nr:DUF2550 domain-containing protein [Granulicoccus phenolivorans]